MRNNSLLTKLIALLLCLVTVGVMFASCSNPEDDQKPDSVKPDKEQESNTPTFVEADLQGREFIFLSKQNEDTDFTDCYIDNEDMNGEPINDAVIERNQKVEEKYNVKFSRRSAELKCTTPG